MEGATTGRTSTPLREGERLGGNLAGRLRENRQRESEHAGSGLERNFQLV
jgi:hypothetical protein